MVKNVYIGLILIGIVSLFFLSSVFAGTPSGAITVEEENSTSAIADNPENNSAIAGNVTEITLFGYSTTQSWQGYFGNVSGAIRLANSAGKVMYNWSQVSPLGQIYASRNGTVSWSYVQCFNYTANGTYCADDTGSAGATSNCGMNISQINLAYNVSTDDSDAVNNTFSANTHASFYVNSLQFGTGECKNVKLYNSTGVGDFDEVLLYEPVGRSVVFTSILKRNVNGFDSNTHDFEMLVLENGHNGDVGTTPYYFYLEIS